MPPRSVLITYTLHPSPSPPHLLNALNGIQSQLPLRNLHWRSSSRAALRTIQEVSVNFVELGEVGSARGKEVNGSVLESPLVNICLVACEDAEVYKNSTRSFIRDWLSLLAARRNVHAPVIILVNPPSSTASSGKNVFGRDKGILGKLKADFNTAKRDRCVQVNLPSGDVEDPALWPEVINKLKESLVTAFDGAILEREEEIRRNDLNRLQPGWNFCTHFLLKESLAHSFEGVNLHEDALIVYEELEATFFQVLKEQNLSWFGKLGANGPQDDSLPILDTASKPYRDLLQTSTITIFDFRVYVFARQAMLLGKIGRITEIAKRGQWFVASLTRRLRESEGDLAAHFIESWTYTACMDIVHKCDEWSRIDRPNGDYSGLIAYESARSELLDIARVQVERIAVAAGHLPDQYPFAATKPLVSGQEDVLFESSDNGLSDTDDNPDGVHVEPLRLSNPAFVEALSDGAKCQALYVHLTKKAIMAYEACGKINSVVRLNADLAGLAIHISDWEQAWDLCRELAKVCAEQHIWGRVASFALDGAFKAYRHLERVLNDEYCNIAIAYLRVCASDSVSAYSDELSTAIEQLKRSETAREVFDHTAFSVRLLTDHSVVAEEVDTSTVSVEVVNTLPIAFEASSIKLQLSAPSLGRIIFSTGAVDLKPGVNALSAQCTTSCTGLFSLESSIVQLGLIDFSYLPRVETLIRMASHAKGPMITVHMPHRIALDEESYLVAEISAGDCKMLDASLHLHPEQDDIQMDNAGATCPDRATTVSASGIAFGSMNMGESISLSIPYTGVSQGDISHMRVNLSYSAPDGSPRLFVFEQNVFMGLPLTVNVQDFFRPRFLLSHFSIASDGRDHLRIGGVDLDSEDQRGTEYQVERRSRKGRWPMMIAPGQSLSAVFKIRQSKPRSSSDGAMLRLVIRYRSVEDEVDCAIQAALTVESDRLTIADRRMLADLSRSRTAWLKTYFLAPTLAGCLPPNASKALRNACETSIVDLPWQTLEIPVEVPSRRIITAVQIDQDQPQVPIFEGRALPMTLTFTTSFAWAGDLTHDNATEMVFDLVSNSEDWLVMGRKKGQYAAVDGQTSTTEFKLVPMRSGELFLPTVQVHSRKPLVDAGGEPILCETYVENAAETIAVLPARTSVTAVIPIHDRRWEGEGI